MVNVPLLGNLSSLGGGTQLKVVSSQLVVNFLF